MRRFLPPNVTPQNPVFFLLAIILFFLTFCFPYAAFSDEGKSNVTRVGSSRLQVISDATQMILEGRQTFRHETFGDEAFWGDTLKLHEAIAGEALGGVGPGVSPIAALSVGLKVDSQGLSRLLKRQIRRGEIDLDSPATTLALLQRNAVVGLTGFFDGTGRIQSMGIQLDVVNHYDSAFSLGLSSQEKFYLVKYMKSL